MALNVEREPEPPSPPKKRTLLRGYNVTISPRCRLLTAGALLLDKTPRGSVRRLSPPASIFLEPVEKVAAVDVEEDDVQELIAEQGPQQGPHIQRWLQPPSTPSTAHLTSSSQLLAEPLSPQPGPSTSVEVAHPSVDPSPGSDMDSDYDDYFDTDNTTRHIYRDIPHNTESDAPLQKALEHFEEAIDQSQEELLGENRTFDCTSDFETFRGTREVFQRNPGPIQEFSQIQDPFLAIWDIHIMKIIAEETNKYAEQILQQRRLPPKSRLHTSSPTNPDEIYRLFAIYIYMGLGPRTKQSEYWMTSTPLEMPKFRQLMSYNRFILLNKFLHFVNNSDSSQSSLQNEGQTLSLKLYKLSAIIHHLNKKFQSLYIPKSNISIDESLTLFKGRLSWIQCIRSKAARFGIKSFELCESQKGYMYKFQIYTGKDTNSANIIDTSTDLGSKATKVVLDLIRCLEGKGYCLTMDNFYNSPALARHLKNLGFDCVGTLRANRTHVPDDVAKLRQNVPKGTIVARHCGDVSVSDVLRILCDSFHHTSY